MTEVLERPAAPADPGASRAAGRSTRRQQRALSGLMVGGAIASILFLVAPTVVVLIVAFGVDRYVTLPPTGWTVDWFRQIGPKFTSAAWLSLRLAATVTVLSLLVGVPAGIGLARLRVRGKAMLEAVIRSPLQVPYVVIGVAMLQYYALIDQAGGLDLLGTMPGLVIAHCVITTPFVVSAVAALMTKFDATLEEAAYGLGAGKWLTFRRVTLPVIRPAVVAGAFFAFLVSFDEVPITLFLSVPNRTTLPVTMFFEAEFSLSPVLYAVSAILTALSSVAVLAFARLVGLRSAMAAR